MHDECKECLNGDKCPAAMEDRILEILATQEATWVIAHKLGMRGQTRKVLRAMKRMEADGLVKRHPHHTTTNSIVWMKAA